MNTSSTQRLATILASCAITAVLFLGVVAQAQPPVAHSLLAQSR